MQTVKNPSQKTKAFANIETRVFVTALLLLTAVLIVCGALSYCIPQGAFERDEAGLILADTYHEDGISGIAPWRVLTAPIRVYASEDALTIIMSGVFNLLEKTGGIRIFIGRLIYRLRDRGGPVVCLTVLIFMLFGSFFGMFEELVTLLPIIIMMVVSMGMDTMTGLGSCLLAACFGFSAAITNPFSVGLASQVADHPLSAGVWLRLVFFAITYVTLCSFLMLHLKRIERDPKSSPSYEIDLVRKQTMNEEVVKTSVNETKIFRVYSVFFLLQMAVLILIASVRAIADLAIPILAASFLISGTVCGLLVSERKRDVALHLGKGAAAMLPAVLIIAFASSAKLVMTESGIMDTIMFRVIQLLDGRNKFLAVLLIYFLILFLQMFIGSASAKIFLVMPVVMPISMALGLSPSLVILAYCMADGFTDVILPTNPVLLVGLSMANISYVKWVKWTWKLQVLIFFLTIAVLFFGVAIGY